MSTLNVSVERFDDEMPPDMMDDMVMPMGPEVPASFPSLAQSGSPSDSPRLSYSSPPPQRVLDFLRLPRTERIEASFDCMVFRDRMVPGKLVITPNYVCFYDPEALKTGGVSMESYLRRAGRLKWTRLWCVLNGDSLSYHESAEASSKGAVAVIRTEQIMHVEPLSRYDGKDNCFAVVSHRGRDVLMADSAKQRQSWVAGVETAAATTNSVIRIPIPAIQRMSKEPHLDVLPCPLSVGTKSNDYLFSLLGCRDDVFETLRDRLMRADPDAVVTDRSVSMTTAGYQSDSFGTDYLSPATSDSETEPGEPLSPREPVMSHELATDRQHHVRRFREHFNLPDDRVIKSYWCAAVKTLREYGRLWVTDRHLCFRASVLGHTTQFQIPYTSIRGLQKESSVWIIPNAIVITTKSNQKILMAGFFSRNKSFDVISAQWRLVRHNAAAIDADVASDGERSLTLSDPHYPMVSEPPTGPMRIVILSVGTRGDVQPFIALGLGLEKAGHQVTIGTHACFEGLVTSYGLRHVDIGGDPRALMELCVANGMFTPKFLKEAYAKFRVFIESLLENCLVACQGCDAIIGSPTAMCSYHVAELLRVPLFGAFTMPFTRTTAYPHPFANPSTPLGSAFNYMSHVMIETVFWQPLRGLINGFRERHGMPAMSLTNGDPYHQKRVPFLYCFSPSVVPKPPDWGDEVDVSGFWFLDAPITWKPSDELLAFMNASDKPLIYIGFGSVTVPDPDGLTRTIVEAVAAADVRCIMVKGWGGLGNVDIPPNVFQIESIPHDWLFPRIKACVHHGGAGTAAAGLRCGLPTVVVHFFGDQGFWGSRISELGAGLSMPLKTVTSDKLASAIRTAVFDDGMRAAAADLGKTVRSEDGVGRAVQHFHRYLPVAHIPPALRPKWSTDCCRGCRSSFSQPDGQLSRHNCRCCGDVFCSGCSQQKLILAHYFHEHPKRVCCDCSLKLKQDGSSRRLV